MSRSSERPAYERVIITGRLRTLSDMHIGAGYDDYCKVERPTKPEKKSRPGNNAGPVEYRFADICLDSYGSAYIPGSTLRGFLSAALRTLADARRREGDSEYLNHLLGCARKSIEAENAQQSDGNPDIGNAGVLRVYDARSAEGAIARRVQAHAKIEPVTATADKHKLFSKGRVRAGSCFGFRLEMDRVCEEEVCLLLNALHTLDGGPNSRLGSGKGTGKGIVRLEEEAVQVLGLKADALAGWLLEEEDTALDEQLTPLSLKPSETAIQSGWTSLDVCLIPLSPLLVDDPIEGWREADDPTRPLIFMRRDSRALIPGETLKGMLRAQGRRILRTLGYDETGADECLAPLFGSDTQGVGALRFDDALDEAAQTKVHHQNFNAVDRFTGGVSEGALYDVEAAYPDKITTRLHLRTGNLDEESMGLLTLLLRDAMEGDLAVGWGKAKGYGALRVEVALPEEEGYLCAWDELLEMAGRNGIPSLEKAKEWVGKLADGATRPAGETAAQEGAR